MSCQFYDLEVASLERTIEDAVTIRFKLPDDLVEAFRYQPGQFLTVRCTVDGERLQRAYSINSAPAAGEPLSITVKRVRDGRVSNFLNDQVQVDQSLKVAEPKGRFCPDISGDGHHTWYLFAGGSGITPVLSILKQVLLIEPYSVVHLIYANRDESQIIFRDALNDLESKYPDRLKVIHVLSKPLSRGWSALWKSYPKWEGFSGRLDEGMIHKILDENRPPNQSVRYLLCGPDGLMCCVRSTLLGMDVPKWDIWQESFGAQTSSEGDTSSVPAQVSFKLDGKKHQIQLEANESLLEGFQRSGQETPFSCGAGVCGSCIAKLKQGQVEMNATMALEASEIEKGYILTCQARARTNHLEVDFDT